MAVESQMLPLGTEAPDFALPDVVRGETVKLADHSDADALLVMFICRHCPYVRHVRGGIATLDRDYTGTGLAIVGISPNDPQE
jgi:peroxiredoxin